MIGTVMSMRIHMHNLNAIVQVVGLGAAVVVVVAVVEVVVERGQVGGHLHDVAQLLSPHNLL